MLENDSMIGAIMYALETLGASVEWRAEGQEGTPDEDVEFLDSIFFQGDMNGGTWDHFIRDTFTTLGYGWSYFETTYKKRVEDMYYTLYPRDDTIGVIDGGDDSPENRFRNVKIPMSKFNDGMIGIKRIQLRAQDTLWQWLITPQGEPVAMRQQHPVTGKIITIPIDKALHLVTKPNRGSPEGYSIIRNAYRDYYMKRRFENIEADGADRDLTGLPVMKVPASILMAAAQGDEQAKAQLKEYQKLVTEVRRNQNAGMVMPSDVYMGPDQRPTQAPKYDLSLVASPGGHSLDTDRIISRKDRGIARTVLSDFMTLGGEAHGNYSLAQNLSSLFITGLLSFLDNVEQGVNQQVIPTLWRLNGKTTPHPVVKHGKVVPNDLDSLAAFLTATVGQGVINADGDEELENKVRGVAGLPKAPPPEEREKSRLKEAELEAEVTRMQTEASNIPEPGGGGAKPNKMKAATNKTKARVQSKARPAPGGKSKPGGLRRPKPPKM